MNSLAQMEIGQKMRVDSVLSTGSMRRRMQDLGIIEGTTIKCIQKSPSGDPTAYLIRGATIAIRSEDAQQILGVHI